MEKLFIQNENLKEAVKYFRSSIESQKEKINDGNLNMRISLYNYDNNGHNYPLENFIPENVWNISYKNGIGYFLLEKVEDGYLVTLYGEDLDEAFDNIISSFKSISDKKRNKVK